LNTSKRFPSRSSFAIFAAAILLAVVFAPMAKAQTARIEDRLPPDTVAFLKWSGSSSLKDAKAKNHFLQLLADPDLAPLEIGAAAYLGKSFAKQNQNYPDVQLPDLVSLLENQVVIGFAVSRKSGGASAENAAKNSSGVFFVYDATGKKDLLDKLDAQSRARNKDSRKYSKYDFGGTTVNVEEQAAENTYEAYVGGYYISSNQKALTEDLVTRFRSAELPSNSLAHRAEYQQSRKYAGGDACIEMFGWMPDLSKLIPQDPKNPTPGRIVQGLHLEKIHAFAFSIDLSGEATRTRGALLGDASPGTIFDLFGSSTPNFETMATVGSSASFQISRVNPAGLYNYVLGAVQGNLPPQQDASLKATQAMAQSYLGMSLGDALALFPGEISQVSFYTPEGNEEKLYGITIQKPEDVLRILRATAASFILSEDTSETSTFLDLTFPYKDPATGTDRRTFYYLAVTPHMLLAAPRKAMVRDAIARLNGGSAGTAANGLLTTPEFAQARSALPQNLSGFSAADFRQIPLDKILANFVNAMEILKKQSKSTEPAPDLTWLKQLKTEAITRHIHYSVGGWWKDSNGVYFDSSFQ
jgi:hypothetical protein